MHLYPVKRAPAVRRLLLPLLLLAVLAGLFFYGLARVSRTAETEQLRLTEQVIHKSLVNCYAIEGIYPPHLDYLEKHYGLAVDHHAFLIDYQVIGANLPPIVQVVRREKAGGA